MAEISTFTNSNGDTYNYKDAVVRGTIAPNENGDISQEGYEEGEIFLWKGRTCVALEEINIGDTLEEEVNFEKRLLSYIIDDKIYDAVYDAVYSALNRSY